MICQDDARWQFVYGRVRTARGEGPGSGGEWDDSSIR